MEKSKLLQNIAKKGKVEVSVLETELAEIINQMPPSDDRERLAIRELNNRYSGPPDQTDKFSICIVGLFNMTDFTKNDVEAALNLYNKDPEQALESGKVKLVDGKPVVIDLREHLGKNTGMKNSNYGKPLYPSYNRNVVVLAREEESSEWVLSDLALRNDFAYTSMPELYTVYNCGLLGSIKDGLKSAKTSIFTKSEEKIDYNGLLTSLAKDKIVMLGEALDEATKHKKDDPGYYRRFIITGGDVKFMNDPKKPGGNYNGIVDDATTDKPITVFVDGALPKPEVGNWYTFVAQSSIGKEWDRERKQSTDEDKVILNVLGYYS